MTRPTAAKGTFPYPHRTVAEVLRDQRDEMQILADLDHVSRHRALTNAESLKMERLLRKVAA